MTGSGEICYRLQYDLVVVNFKRESDVPQEGAKHQQQRHQVRCLTCSSHSLGFCFFFDLAIWAPPPELQRHTQGTNTQTSAHTYNLPLLAEERVALQRLAELTLGDVGKDLVLSFICCAVGDPEEGRVEMTSTVRTRWPLR